jgi:hypothetical protein
MRLNPLRLVHLSLVRLLLILSGCTQKATQVTPIDNKALFDDNSLRNARPISISSEAELKGLDLNNDTQATELPYDETEADSQLSAQAVLAGAKGFVALYRKSGTTYQIRVYNQTNNAVIPVYSGTQEVQSVAVNAAGNRVVASMKNPSSNKFDIYLFQLDNGGTSFQLTTTNGLDETNVSITRSGNKIAWERRTSSTNTLIRPFICTYNATTHSCALTSITNTVSQIQPSLSANGLYLAFVRVLSGPTRYEVVRYRFSDSSYTIIEASTSTDVFADPSIDDTGSKIMYLWKRSTPATNFIRIRNFLTNTIVTELSTTNTLEHPFITADGQFTTYSQLNTGPNPDRMQVKTRNITSNVIATQDTGSFDYFQPFWMVPCGSGTTITGDQTLTTQAEVNALAGVSKITGNLILDPTTTSLDLSPLASLTEVTGNFGLNFNNIQTSLAGFECLTSVGKVNIDSNNALTSISGFAALNSVGDAFNITNHAALTNISGFAALNSVGGQFDIFSNSAITSIPSFAALNSVGGDFSIINNSVLTTFSGFAALNTVGSFRINSNSALTSITGFNLLESGCIAGTATVLDNLQLNCQNPDPHFSPVDFSTSNLVNCFTDIAVVGFALANEAFTASYTPDPNWSYNASGSSITANRTATGTYNITFTGLTLDTNSNIQVTSFDTMTAANYCNVVSVVTNKVNIKCYNAATNALVDSVYNIAITDKTTGSDAKVSAYVLANNKTSASYTPASNTSYSGYGAGITATRSATGTYMVSFTNGDFETNATVLVTALDDRAYCRSAGWNATDAFVYCFNETGVAIDSRYSLAVIDATPPVGTTTRIVGYAFADKGDVASYTPNPIFAYNQTGFGVSATRTVAGIYHTIFTGLNLSTNYHVQVTSRGNNANYCVLGPPGPIFGSDDVLATCYNSAGTLANTVFSIWVVQK